MTRKYYDWELRDCYSRGCQAARDMADDRRREAESLRQIEDYALEYKNARRADGDMCGVAWYDGYADTMRKIRHDRKRNGE